MCYALIKEFKKILMEKRIFLFNDGENLSVLFPISLVAF